jgi:hypothetical protein
MSNHVTAVEALAAAASGLVSERRTADVLTDLVLDCTSVLDARSVAILVTVETKELALLNASSHEAAEIELLQGQSLVGPCVDVIRSGEQVVVAGEADMKARWGEVGTAMSAAGYRAVDAYPMRWGGRVLGGLNVFRESPAGPDPELRAIGQAFADFAALLVVHNADIPIDQIKARVYDAVQARSIVEQAKGVLAYVHRVDPAHAYDLLLDRASREGGLTVAALQVVSEQHQRVE